MGLLRPKLTWDTVITNHDLDITRNCFTVIASAETVKQHGILNFRVSRCISASPLCRRGLKESGDGPCMGYRPVVEGKVQGFEWFTYKEIWTRVKNFGSGLTNLELVNKNEDGNFAGWLFTCPASF